jgi:hypothetical protein
MLGQNVVFPKALNGRMRDLSRPKFFVMALAIVIPAVGSPDSEPFHDRFPPPAQKQQVKQPTDRPKTYFRYYSDAEVDPKYPFTTLNHYVINLHSKESLVFDWPKGRLSAPVYDPLEPGDDRRLSRDLPGEKTKSYQLDPDAPIFFTQARQQRDASAYTRAQPNNPTTTKPTLSAETLRSVYSRKRAPGLDPAQPLTVEINSRVREGRVELDMSSSLPVDFGLAFSPTSNDFWITSRNDVRQRAVNLFERVEELKYPPQFLQRVITIIHLEAHATKSLAVKPTSWRYQGVPIFLIRNDYLIPAGLASIYEPVGN